MSRDDEQVAVPIPDAPCDREDCRNAWRNRVERYDEHGRVQAFFYCESHTLEFLHARD